MTKKRGRFQIIYDILKVIGEREGRIRRTHILYKSNLSNQMLEEYLPELLAKQFITEVEKSGAKTYVLTERGHQYLNKYKFFIEFTESFGLNDE